MSTHNLIGEEQDFNICKAEKVTWILIMNDNRNFKTDNLNKDNIEQQPKDIKNVGRSNERGQADLGHKSTEQTNRGQQFQQDQQGLQGEQKWSEQKR
jgi:hypothetical protein